MNKSVVIQMFPTFVGFVVFVRFLRMLLSNLNQQCFDITSREEKSKPSNSEFKIGIGSLLVALGFCWSPWRLYQNPEDEQN